jgi:hypothetical protein
MVIHCVLKADETIAWNKTITSRFSLIPRQIGVLRKFTTYAPLKDHAHTRMPSWFKTKLQETLSALLVDHVGRRSSNFTYHGCTRVVTTTKSLQDKRLEKARLNSIVSAVTIAPEASCWASTPGYLGRVSNVAAFRTILCSSSSICSIFSAFYSPLRPTHVSGLPRCRNPPSKCLLVTW